MALRSAFAVLFCFATAFVARAEPDCSRGGNDQREMNECAYLKGSAADQKLNEKYKIIMSCLGSSSVPGKRLIEAELAWIKFKGSECDFKVGTKTDFGSMQSQLIMECSRELVERRIKGLDYYLTCPAESESGPECPTQWCKFPGSAAKPKPAP